MTKAKRETKVTKVIHVGKASTLARQKQLLFDERDKNAFGFGWDNDFIWSTEPCAAIYDKKVVGYIVMCNEEHLVEMDYSNVRHLKFRFLHLPLVPIEVVESFCEQAQDYFAEEWLKDCEESYTFHITYNLDTDDEDSDAEPTLTMKVFKRG